MTKEAMKLALEALTYIYTETTADEDELIDQAITAIKEALAQSEQDNTYIYASSLATAIWQKHYMKESPKFALFDTTEGVLTQIDNMTCGLVREKTAQPEQKYHRGDRLICLETEEYCVIHISGTDRQWVKFPDSHIGVYTNKQVAELFELLPKEPEQGPVAWITPDGEGFRIRFSPPINDVPLGWDALYTTPPQRKPLTDEEILEVWKENEKVYPMDRSRLLDRTRACIRKAQIEVGCAECGVGGGHALYCVTCAEKFVGEADTKLQQKQETIEGLNRDYDLLFAEYQLLLKGVRHERR